MKRSWLVLRNPDVNTEGGGSSTSTQDVKADSSSDNDSTATEASAEKDAEKVVKEPTIAEVAQAAYEKSIGKESTAEQKTGEDDEGAVQNLNPTDEDKEKKEVSESADVKKAREDEEDKNQTSVSYDRFKEVNETKKQFEAKVAEFEPQIKEYNSIVDYCKSNAISPDEFRQGLEFIRLSKTDPTAAREALRPVWEQLSGLTGDSLPVDLAKDVEDGTLTKARATELAKLRGQVSFRGAQTQTFQQQTEQVRQQQFQVELGNSLKAWSTSKSTTDLGFKPKVDATKPDGKYELVADRFYKLMSQSLPKTSADAIKLVEQAYTEISKSLAGFAPKQVVANKNISSTKSSTVSIKEPTTIKEVVAAVMARHKA